MQEEAGDPAPASAEHQRGISYSPQLALIAVRAALGIRSAAAHNRSRPKYEDPPSKCIAEHTAPSHTLQVDSAFVEVMIELELIDQPVRMHTDLWLLTRCSLGAHSVLTRCSLGAQVDLTRLLASTAKTPQGAAAEEHSINDLQMISDDWMPL